MTLLEGLKALHFVWVDVSFLLNYAPIGRLEVFLMVVANAMAVVLLLTLLMLRVVIQALDKRAIRWKALTERVEVLERTRAESGLSGTSHHY